MTIADSLTLLNATKNEIKAAIEDKGVTVGSAPFADYPEKIMDITTGPLVTLDGPTSVDQNDTVTYTITNYNSFSTYAVSVSAGTISIVENTITFNAPASEQTITLTVTVDGLDTAFAVEVLSPYIATPATTPSNFGDAFEGGFYAGMIWNELIQTNTETTNGTGAKTFDCPTLTSPVTYIGHEIEIRSRANPANHMKATVTSCSLGGKTITVNVTSVNGSGTFSDWSIMSRYRVIVAPKASGETNLVIKNSQTALPVECQTLTEGWRATLAMFNADTSTVYPAAHWARGRNIGGHTDWYVPARDELEIAFRNLKPNVTSNILALRPTPTINYQTLGSFGDASNENGVNLNSAPNGSAYTGSVPGQTPVEIFKTGGSEAIERTITQMYLTSSEYSAAATYYQEATNLAQSRFNKAAGARGIRVVRRSII